MITLIETVKSFQANYLPQQASFWAYQSVIDAIENHKTDIDTSSIKRQAISLMERFTSYGIEATPETRFQFSKFASLQYINLITVPEMDIEDVVRWMLVAGEISRLTFNK